MIFNQTISGSPRNFALPTNFRLTNFIFKKPPLPSSIEVNCIPRTHHSFTLSPRQHSSPQTLQKNCTNFMKGYIDRLKRERKRKNKQLKSNPRNNGFDGLYNPKHNDVLILERISLKSPNINSIYQNQKVSQLIKQIKKSKKSGKSIIKEIFQENQKLEENKVPNYKLLPLNTQIKPPKLKRNLPMNFNKLQPWNNDVSQNVEFSIQGFNQ